MLRFIRNGMEQFLRRLPRHFTVAFGVVCLLLFLDVTSIINCRERDSYDFRMKLRPIEKGHPNIVLLAIDDPSLQAMGPWPWPRHVHADMIHVLKAAGAQLIFFDVLYPEKSQNPKDDQRLAEEIKAAGNVILSFHYLTRKPFQALFPLPEFQKGMRSLGYANVDPDPKDGVIRHVYPVLYGNGRRYDQGALAVFRSLFEQSSDADEWEKDYLQHFSKGMLINYPGGLDVFQKISAGEVFERSKTAQGRDFLKRVFDGKIVLIGHIATGTTDMRSSPIQPMMPGLVVQASALHTLLTGKYLIEIPMLWNFVLAFFISWGIAWLCQRLRPQWSFAATIGLMVLYTAVNCFVFYYFRYVFHLPMPLVAMFTVFVLSLFLKYMDVRIESDFLARELEMASKIQQSLLPASDLKTPDIEAGFRCLFYEQVGGDLYDWIDLGEGRVALCLGDVSGKGVPAALYMSRALNELRHHAGGEAKPGETLTILNQKLSQGETSGMFLTLFFVIVDTVNRRISFANAGHDPMVLFQKKAGKAVLVGQNGGLPIGIMDGIAYETEELSFESGDAFLLTSDGIKEQKSPKGEMFGSERLQVSLEKAQNASDAQALLDTVMNDVFKFAMGRSPHDDRTLVCARIPPK